jgi:hypothetical protein
MPMDFDPAPLDIVDLREEIGIAIAKLESPDSLAAAATAATVVALADMLLRRVIR